MYTFSVRIQSTGQAATQMEADSHACSPAAAAADLLGRLANGSVNDCIR